VCADRLGRDATVAVDLNAGDDVRLLLLGERPAGDAQHK